MGPRKSSCLQTSVRVANVSYRVIRSVRTARNGDEAHGPQWSNGIAAGEKQTRYH